MLSRTDGCRPVPTDIDQQNTVLSACVSDHAGKTKKKALSAKPIKDVTPPLTASHIDKQQRKEQIGIMSLSITLKVGKRKAPDAVLPAVAAAPEHTPAATAAVAVVAASALPVSAAASLPEHSLRSYTFKRSKPVAVAAVDKQPAPLKNLKAILAAEEPTALPNYLSIAAPPSLVPPKKCAVGKAVMWSPGCVSWSFISLRAVLVSVMCACERVGRHEADTVI